MVQVERGRFTQNVMLGDSMEKMFLASRDMPYTDSVKKWKAAGGRAVGWVCTYVPEEVIHAGGILPVRITGGTKGVSLDNATAYLYITSCSTVRSFFDLCLQGQYDFLDGIVSGAICDQARRMFDIWCYFKPTFFKHAVGMPAKTTDFACEYYKSEVTRLAEALESSFGVTITSEKLTESINIFNKTRELLKRVYELRKSDGPLVAGSTVMEIFNASTAMVREEFNQCLEEIVDELESGKPTAEQPIRPTRLFLHGCMLNNVEFVRLIEQLGGAVVADDLCSGMRHFLDQVDLSTYPDPWEALARRYTSRFPCPRMFATQDRLDRILSLLKEYRIQGIVSETVRFCAPLAWEQSEIKQMAEAIDVPVLQVNLEYGTGVSARIKARVQAFLEMLGGE